MSADVMADAVFMAVKGYVAKEFERMVAPLIARLHELEQRPPVVGLRGERGEKGMDGSNGRDGKDGRDGERGESGEKGERGEQGPAGKDGINGKDAEVDYDRIGNMIAVAVEKEVGKFPIPRDGRDGKDGRDGERGEKGDRGDRGEKGDPGRDGKDADEEVIVRRVRELIPTPKDGRDGANGRDGAHGPQGERGEKGDPGVATVDYDSIAEQCQSIIARTIEQFPKPRDGKDGANGRDADEDVIVTRILASIPKPRDGIDGQQGPQGEPGRDGRDGLPGVPGQQGEKGDPGHDGKDGADGLSIEDIDADYNDETSVLTLRMSAGERVVEKRFALNVPRDADLYVSGKHYLKGQVVTYGGSAFIARRDTSALIGGDPPSPDWRLLVKRGRSAT